MKTKRKHWLLPAKRTLRILLVSIIAWFYIMAGTGNGQTPKTIAVLNIDTKDLELDPVAMGNLVRLELEKTKVYNVMDKYEVAYIVEKEGLDISNCYGKTCLLEIAKSLEVDKLITGYAERFGDKIIVNLRLIDVKSSQMEKSDVTEYQNIQEEIQIMIEISIKKLLGLEIDPNLVNLLVNYEDPIISTRTNLKLNGPRMGIAYITGDKAERIMAPKSQGGFDGYPYLSQIGYQYEIQYLSAGNFQALVEFLFMFSGLEQKFFNPNIVFMNGFRVGKSGWEVAFGPSVSLRQTAKGFYDEQLLMGGEIGEWYLEKKWLERFGSRETNPYEIQELLDNRGDIVIQTGWVWAIGRTFKSGYLNIPVNAYVSPDKEGWYIGLSIGFNVSRTRRIQE
ncbi:MAG: hypothetical protein JSV22_13145 [Bacteroidales bacterium]|nr:MAG: hypothetical protein JSV22_13145 [Bacteroidales bacterium]